MFGIDVNENFAPDYQDPMPNPESKLFSGFAPCGPTSVAFIKGNTLVRGNFVQAFHND